MTHVLMMHTTWTDNLPSIMERGLEPRDTLRHNYPHEAEANHGTPRVYLRFLRNWPWSLPGGGAADEERVLLVDVVGLELEPDEEGGPDCRRCPTVIAPERLSVWGDWDVADATLAAWREYDENRRYARRSDSLM